MEPRSTEQPVCSNCGSPLQPEHRFCPNCGTPVSRETTDEPSAAEEYAYEGLFAPGAYPEDSASPEPTAEQDPSILETREHSTQEAQYQAPSEPGPPPPPASPVQDAGHPTWGTEETTVQAERGNRTLWIIVGIIAFIVLVCCCILPLALTIIANVDTTFQNEIRSSSSLVSTRM